MSSPKPLEVPPPGVAAELSAERQRQTQSSIQHALITTTPNCKLTRPQYNLLADQPERQHRVPLQLHGQDAERPERMVPFGRQLAQLDGRLLRDRQRDPYTVPWFDLQQKRKKKIPTLTLLHNTLQKQHTHLVYRKLAVICWLVAQRGESRDQTV